MISREGRLPFSPEQHDSCYHGGAFFSAIGPEFDRLDRRQTVISADVLDAWFPPSPRVLTALASDPAWLLRTSPPTQCEGMIRVVARARGVAPENIVVGAGSSSLIFQSFLHWLNSTSRVLILDPTYGEYAHVLERVVGCNVDRFPLSPDTGYRVDLDLLAARFQQRYDVVVLVNPNSPTGQHILREPLVALLQTAPLRTRVWIDETYVEYVGKDESVESFAASSSNVVVCKSMSKVYALSGARCAYLCGPVEAMSDLRRITPPWAVSLPGQVAAVAALQDPDYYAERYEDTHRFRGRLVDGLALLGWRVFPSCANFVLCHLPESGPDADEIVERCRRHDLFVRNAREMGLSLGSHAIRIAVKDDATTDRMLETLRWVTQETARSRNVYAERSRDTR